MRKEETTKNGLDTEDTLIFSERMHMLDDHFDQTSQSKLKILKFMYHKNVYSSISTTTKILGECVRSKMFSKEERNSQWSIYAWRSTGECGYANCT